MAAKAAVTARHDLRDVKGETGVHLGWGSMMTALHQTLIFAEASEGPNLAAAQHPREGESSKLMKGQARLFACSHLQVFVIKLNEDVTEIHWRESQTGIPTGNPGTLKIF